MKHDELAKSLAGHLRTEKRMVWQDMQLGPSGSVRPDVYAIYKSYTHPCPMAYECKVSISDFRSDVTSGKWQSYLRYASGVYFACEAGLISKADVPPHCGLIVFKNGQWRAAKKAVLNPVIIPQEACLKLLIDGVEREGPIYRRKRFNETATLENVKQRFGDAIATTVRDMEAAHLAVESAQYQADWIVKDAKQRAEQIRTQAAKNLEPLRIELCDVLGLPHTTDSWRLKNAIATLRRDAREHPAIAKLKALTGLIERALNQHRWEDITEP